MRAEMAKPPKMLTEAIKIATNRQELSADDVIAPRMIIPDMAFDMLISGEYSAGVIFKITR